MSVKFDEAFCFDSFQDRLLWFDDFHGDQVQDEWDFTFVGAGTGVVVDQQTGGIVRLASGALNGNSSSMDWNDIRSLLVVKRVSMETRLKLTTVNATTGANIALVFDGNNRILFRFPGTVVAANWDLWTRNGGAATSVNSGVAVDTDYHIYRIEVHTHGGNHVHFYIDGVECDNSPINTNLPVTGGSEYLQPYFYISTSEAVAKSMDVDYCYVRQDR